MFDNLANERCSTCLTTSKANNARVRHVRQRAKRVVFDMFDNEHSEQEKSSLVYRFPKYDFLINRVQLILSFNLLLRLFSCKSLLSSDCLHCLKTSTNLSYSKTRSNIFEESTSVTL